MSQESREWLKEERKKRGLSQGKLALMIGIDKGYVYRKWQKTGFAI